MTPLKSQLLGILLALATAIGCIAYERLVKNFSISMIFILSILFFVPATIIYAITNGDKIVKDWTKLLNSKQLIMFAVIYMITWITTPLWYNITKSQGVMVSSIYEVKYIILMALIYIAFGENRFTINTAIGVALAMGSIYFISKT
jgi:drug/metabolite transporter (DMT)-like permease